MRLFEHPDFATLIVATAERLGMPPDFVEKDYYVTEALRIAQQKLAGLFKSLQGVPGQATGGGGVGRGDL